MAGYRLVIGNRNHSSWSWRPWLALKQTGAAFEEVVIALDMPDTAAQLARHSPSGRVPVLQHGPRTVWDSLAICEYLAEQHPEARLWPADPDARAFARSACAEMHSGFAALRNHCSMDVKARRPGRGLDQPGVAQDVARIVALWEEARRRFGAGGPFLCGGYGIVDAFFTPVVSRFVTYGVQLTGEAKRYADAVWEQPFTVEWRRAAEAEVFRMARYEQQLTGRQSP